MLIPGFPAGPVVGPIVTVPFPFPVFPELLLPLFPAPEGIEIGVPPDEPDFPDELVLPEEPDFPLCPQPPFTEYSSSSVIKAKPFASTHSFTLAIIKSLLQAFLCLKVLLFYGTVYTVGYRANDTFRCGFSRSRTVFICLY